MHWYWIGSSQVWLLGRFPIYRETSEEPHLRWILYYSDRVQSIQWIRFTLHWHLIQWIRLTLHWHWIGSSQVWLLSPYCIDIALTFYWHCIDISLTLHSHCIDIQLTLHCYSIDTSLTFHWNSIDILMIVLSNGISLALNWHSIGSQLTFHL